MKRIQLIKAANDFAFAHYQDGLVTLAINSATAFKTAGGADEDFHIWNNEVNQGIVKFSIAVKQKLPSEIKAEQAVKLEATTLKSNTELATSDSKV